MFKPDDWDRLSSSEKESLAKAWLAELRGEKGGDLGRAQFSVMTMMFAARPDIQWDFLLKAIELAQTDEELRQIAVGPLETLLGRHGEQLIAAVEEQAQVNTRFLRTLTSVWRHGMPDDTWNRVQAIQARCDNPLR